MTLWNKIEPFCKNLPYTDAFLNLIEKKQYGYFSQKVHGISGYYEEKYLVIVLYLLKDKEGTPKKIFKAKYISLEADGCKESFRVFKRETHKKRGFERIQHSFLIHAVMQKAYPQAVADAPTIIGKKEKIVDSHECLRIDTIEEVYPSTFSRNHMLKGKISLEKTVEGLFHIAIALQDMHKRNFIHADIKNWNIFVVEGRLKLFDFDNGDRMGFTLQRNEYPYWDAISNLFGLIYPFRDVFGWTMVLGIALGGSDFYKIIFENFMNAEINKPVQDLFKQKSGDFYMPACEFISKVFDVNNRLKNECITIVEKAKKENINAMDMLTQIANLTLNAPSMDDCVEFIRPWVSRLSQAK